MQVYIVELVYDHDGSTLISVHRDFRRACANADMLDKDGEFFKKVRVDLQNESARKRIGHAACGEWVEVSRHVVLP